MFARVCGYVCRREKEQAIAAEAKLLAATEARLALVRDIHTEVRQSKEMNVVATDLARTRAAMELVSREHIVMRKQAADETEVSRRRLAAADELVAGMLVAKEEALVKATAAVAEKTVKEREVRMCVVHSVFVVRFFDVCIVCLSCAWCVQAVARMCCDMCLCVHICMCPGFAGLLCSLSASLFLFCSQSLCLCHLSHFFLSLFISLRVAAAGGDQGAGVRDAAVATGDRGNG